MTKAWRRWLLVAWVALLLSPLFAQDGQQQFANLGDLTLESGDVLHDCRIGYRTFGKLNPDRSNVILFPTWAGGTTEQLAGSIGAAKLADSSKYFVIAIDALSNGVSSRPPIARRSHTCTFRESLSATWWRASIAFLSRDSAFIT